MRDIKQAIQEHKAKVLEFYPEYQILGVFLYGSQNYNIAIDNSDVDTKAIIIPHIRDLTINPVKIKTLEFENGEHCEIMDIMHLVANFRKQNINFVEVLFTQYCWVNPIYAELWNCYFKQHNEDIANYNPQQCIKSICGQAIHTLNQNKTDAKKYANALRLSYFLKSYVSKCNYLSCITVPEEQAKFLKYLKLNKPVIKEENADNLIKLFQNIMSETSFMYLNKTLMNLTDSYMDAGIIEMVRKCIAEYEKFYR